ncbi:MAG: alpha/beta hydrolase [Acidimicrobiales bacterium]|nr:alpha/beta hydrolase [Acidimicrobiales bacterium]
MVRSRDGVEIAYETHGDPRQPAVVLVHGWAGNRTYWRHQMDALAATYFVVALDLGGHGESGVCRNDWNLPAFGDDVAAVVNDLDLGKVVLVGHSMGGDAIVFAATQLGDCVAGLVWVDTLRSLGDEPHSTPETIDAFAAPFREDFESAVDGFARGLFPASANPALVDRVAGEMAGAPREAAVGSIGYALNRHPPLIAALKEISAPLVAINPDVSPTDVDSLSAHGIETVIVEGVGHFSMLEDPDQFNAKLLNSLKAFDGFES